MNSTAKRIKRVVFKSLLLDEKVDRSVEQIDLQKIEDYGVVLDSMAVLEIIIGLEEEFNIIFDGEELTGDILKEVDVVRELIERKQADTQ